MSLVGMPVRAGGQAPGHRVGVLTPAASQWEADTFRQTLRDLGYVEGQNLRLDVRSADGRLDRMPALAADLVRAGVDIIVGINYPGTRAAMDATTTVPIVMVAVGNPIALGLVGSLARPEGNVTGVTNMAGDLCAKRLALLKEALPAATRVALLLHPDEPIVAPPLQGSSRPRAGCASSCGGSASAPRPASRVPSARSSGGGEAEAGALMSYFTDQPGIYRRVAQYVDRLLKGAQTADLPVEQPTKFDRVIKTARALGLTVPQTLLLRADYSSTRSAQRPATLRRGDAPSRRSWMLAPGSPLDVARMPSRVLRWSGSAVMRRLWENFSLSGLGSGDGIGTSTDTGFPMSRSSPATS